MADLLRTVSGDPGEHRARICHALRVRTGSDAFIHFTVHLAAGQHLCSELAFDGENSLLGEWRRYVGKPFHFAAHGWDPRDPPPKGRRSFTTLSYALRRLGRRSSIYRNNYKRFGVRDQARILLYDQDTFLGWLGGLRLADRSAYSARRVGMLDRLTPALVAAFAACERADRVGLEDGSNYLVANAAGWIEFSSEGARGWLTDARLGELRDAVLAFDACKAPRRVPFTDASVYIVRLDGSLGVRYLLTLRNHELIRRRMLSTRQHEVASFAVAGATVAEIAAEMGISEETVRGHLKAAYRRLGVATRLELARSLARLDESQTVASVMEG